jgi:hypothetical protein
LVDEDVVKYMETKMKVDGNKLKRKLVAVEIDLETMTYDFLAKIKDHYNWKTFPANFTPGKQIIKNLTVEQLLRRQENDDPNLPGGEPIGADNENRAERSAGSANGRASSAGEAFHLPAAEVPRPQTRRGPSAEVQRRPVTATPLSRDTVLVELPLAEIYKRLDKVLPGYKRVVGGLEADVALREAGKQIKAYVRVTIKSQGKGRSLVTVTKRHGASNPVQAVFQKVARTLVH